MEEIINEFEINDNSNIAEAKPKKIYQFTEKRQEAFKRMQEGRKKKIDDLRQRKTSIVLEKPKLKRSETIGIIEEPERQYDTFNKSDESSETDSSNYESDDETKKVIISNYDEKEPESKLIIKKVKRKVNKKELKKIYDEVKKEDDDEKDICDIEDLRVPAKPKIKPKKHVIEQVVEEQIKPIPKKRIIKPKIQKQKQVEPNIIYL